MEFCQLLNRCIFQACTLTDSIYIKTVRSYVGFEPTLPQLPKEDSRSMSTAIRLGHSYMQLLLLSCKTSTNHGILGKIRCLCRHFHDLPTPNVPRKIVDTTSHHDTIALPARKPCFIEYLISHKSFTNFPDSNVLKKVVA